MTNPKVVIEVMGGIAYVVECPPDIDVIINDLD
jgi:spermidine synthase